MKQLLIVNSGKALNATGATPNDLSKLDSGAITFFELGSDKAMSSKYTKNFGIALGRPNGQLPLVIPEVDVKSLTVTKADGAGNAGIAMVCEVTLKDTEKEVGFMIVKKGTVPHERNTNTFSIMGTGSKTADATKLANDFGNRNKVMALPFTVSASSGKLTITCTKVGEMYTVVAIGDATVVETKHAKPATCDKAYVQDLASRCAAGKGFNDTYRDGDSNIPGYPEEVEDTTYNVYTLRFAVGRASAKTRDEVVTQVVHIAVPTGNSAVSNAIETILGLKTTTPTGE